MEKTDAIFHIDARASKILEFRGVNSVSERTFYNVTNVGGFIREAVEAITNEIPLPRGVKPTYWTRAFGWVTTFEAKPGIFWVKVSQTDASLKQMQVGFAKRGIVIIDESQLAV